MANKIRNIKKGVNLAERRKREATGERASDRVCSGSGEGGGRRGGGDERESEMAGRERSLEQEIGGMLPSLTGSRR